MTTTTTTPEPSATATLTRSELSLLHLGLRQVADIYRRGAAAGGAATVTAEFAADADRAEDLMARIADMEMATWRD